MAKLLDKKINGKWPYAYVPAAQTDLRKRFTDERKRLAALAEEGDGKVTQIKRKGRNDGPRR